VLGDSIEWNSIQKKKKKRIERGAHVNGVATESLHVDPVPPHHGSIEAVVVPHLRGRGKKKGISHQLKTMIDSPQY
jgi:hypothetical protein